MLTPGFYDSAMVFTFGGLASHFPAYAVRITGSGGRRGAVKRPVLSEGTIFSTFISKSIAAKVGDALSHGGKGVAGIRFVIKTRWIFLRKPRQPLWHFRLIYSFIASQQRLTVTWAGKKKDGLWSAWPTEQTAAEGTRDWRASR